MAGVPEGSRPIPPRYNVRSMHTSHTVTVMKRFEAFLERRASVFNAKSTFKRAIHTVKALKRLGTWSRQEKDLSADFVVITGHEGGLLQVRNFDTGEVVGNGKHFNDATVSCCVVSNSYIFTAVEKSRRRGSTQSLSTDDCDIYVWDMTNLNQIAHSLEGHTDRVSTIAVGPWNETQPVSGSVDKTIIIWDLAMGRRPVRILKGHTMMVKSVLLTRSFIISGSTDQSLRVWSWDGAEIAHYETAHAGPIQFMSFGLNHDTIISACGGGIIRESLIDGNGLKALWQNKAAKGQILDVAFDDNYVVSSSTEGPAVNFFVRSTKENKRFTLHEQSVRTLEMDGSRQQLLSGSDDGVIIVWNYSEVDKDRTPQPLLSVQAHRSSITSILLDVDPQGQWERIFTCSDDHSIFVLDFDLERDSRTYKVEHPPTHFIEISPTGSLVTTEGESCSVWNAARMEHKSVYSEGQWGYMQEHKATIRGLSYSHQEQKIVTGGEEAALYVWDISLYKEAGFKREELITVSDHLEMRSSVVCLSECFGQIVGVGMNKPHHHSGQVAVVNFVSGATISHFSTPALPMAIGFVGIPDEEITQVITQLITGDVILYELAGKAIKNLHPVQFGDMEEEDLRAPREALSHVVPYLGWMDMAYDPPHAMLIVTRNDVVKELRVVLDGVKNFSELKATYTKRFDSTVTCMALVKQAAMHCVVGTERGVFRVLDRNGTTLYTVNWDGCTVNEFERQHTVVVRNARRESFSNSYSEIAVASATAVDASLKARYIAMGFADGCTLLWDTAHKRVTRRFHPHFQAITKTLLLPLTRRVVTATKNAIRFDIVDVRDDHGSERKYLPD